MNTTDYGQEYQAGFAHGREVGIATGTLRTDARYADLLRHAVVVLARLDLEASGTDDDFPCRALREDLRCSIQAITGRPQPNPYGG